MANVGSTGIDEFTIETEGLAAFLEFDAEVGGVSRVGLRLTHGGSGIVEEIDGRIVGGDERVGRVFRDPGQDGFAGGEKLREGIELLRTVSGEAEGVGTVVIVRGPGDHLLWVERGLGSHDGGGEKAGRFARDRIGTAGIRQIGVKSEPERGARAGGTAVGSDAVFIEVPLRSAAADELEGASGIEERTLHRWVQAIGGGIEDKAVVDTDDGNASGEVRRRIVETGFVALQPAAAVNEEVRA